jgi:hypothetical protein
MFACVHATGATPDPSTGTISRASIAMASDFAAQADWCKRSEVSGNPHTAVSSVPVVYSAQPSLVSRPVRSA